MSVTESGIRRQLSAMVVPVPRGYKAPIWCSATIRMLYAGRQVLTGRKTATSTPKDAKTLRNVPLEGCVCLLAHNGVRRVRV
jgi:hypothetical protein